MIRKMTYEQWKLAAVELDKIRERLQNARLTLTLMATEEPKWLLEVERNPKAAGKVLARVPPDPEIDPKIAARIKALSRHLQRYDGIEAPADPQPG